MSDEKNGVAGAPTAITQKKIDNLYSIVQMYKSPTIISRMLSVDLRTFQSWIEKGEQALEKHAELYAEISDCMLDGIVLAQKYMTENEENLKARFMEETYAETVNVKNAYRYKEFLEQELTDTIKNITDIKESELIDNFRFHENSKKDNTIKQYVKIARIFVRANLDMDKKYLKNIDMHAGTGKNVSLSRWMLETRHSEFRPQQSPNINISNNDGGVVSLMSLFANNTQNNIQSSPQNLLGSGGEDDAIDAEIVDE